MIQLINGDCLEEMAKIPDGSVDAVICDPPYGTTACKWDTCIPFEPMWEQLKRITKKNGAIALFGSQPFTSALVMSNPKMFKYEWVWEKSPTGFLNAKKMPMKSIENISVFYEKLPTYNPQGLTEINKEKTNHKTKKEKGAIGLSTHNGGRLPDNYFQKNTGYPRQVLRFNNDKGHHPTQKPVALLEYLIKTYTNEGETVLDFTMGSGTTGVACKNLNRNFIGIELDKGYFDIAEKRLEELKLKI